MKKLSKRIISALLSLVLLFVCIPLTVGAAPVSSTNNFTYVADASTMDAWKNVFEIGDTISTENAGGVWMDKSVFLTSDEFRSLKSRVTENGVEVVKTIDLEKQDNSFLVALSGIASNVKVVSYNILPQNAEIFFARL